VKAPLSKNMKIFITGHKGLIGQDIMPLFGGHEIVGYDKKDGQELADTNCLRKTIPDKTDIVFHLANIPHPSPDILPIEYKTHNTGETICLLEVCAEKKVGGIVFFSSLAAIGFDSPVGEQGLPFFHVCDPKLKWPDGKPPWDENTKTIPIDYDFEKYGASKVAQEKLIKESGIPYLILRLGPYGPMPGPEAEHTVYNDAVCKEATLSIVKKILEVGVPLKGNTIHVCREGMWGGKILKSFLEGKKVVKKEKQQKRK